MKKMRTNTSILLLCTWLCTPIYAATIYIDQAAGDDNNDGSTPANAVATITRGKALADSGDTLDIGPGTYGESDGENYPLIFQEPLNLQGAGPDVTILDGELATRIRVLEFRDTPQTVDISGLSIINATDGGVRVNEVTQINFSDCRFENNSDNSAGGAIVFFNTLNININDCQFFGNEASSGGAIQVQINENVDINLEVSQSTFVDNMAGGGGAAISFQGNGEGVHSLIFDQNVFTNNDSEGMTLRFGDSAVGSRALVSNSIFTGHESVGISAQTADIDVINSTFVENRVGIDAGNTATGNDINIVNSIFWDNSFRQIRGDDGTISYSIIEDLDIDGHIDVGNNLDIDPLLDSDFRLTENSPAIDMGSDAAADAFGLSNDIDGEVRKIDFSGLNLPGGVVDIGADEKLDLIFKNGFEPIDQ